MPYTVKLPPTMRRQQKSGDVAASSPLATKPVTAVTTGSGAGMRSTLDPLALSQADNTETHGTGPNATALAQLMGMPLDLFAREGQLLEVRVPYLDQTTLWFVPSESDAEGLTQEGISRGRIWTARELADLLSCAGLRPHDVKAVALAKIELGGDVVEVRRR
jgi:hypothetical protein